MIHNRIEAFNWNCNNKYFQEVFQNTQITIVDKTRYIYKVDNIIFCPRSHIPYVCNLYSEPLILVVASNMLCADDDHILYKEDHKHWIIDNEHGDMRKIQNFELTKNIHRIYATNCFIHDSQHIALPYGIQSLEKYYHQISTNIEPTKWCYANFKLHARPGTCHRKHVLEVLHPDVTIINYNNNNQPETYIKYYHELQQYYFIASPEGTGPDCYRTWDSLYLNRYPILDKSNMTKHWEDLPIVQIDDWSKLSSSFLKEELSRIQTSTFNLNKLDHRWWWQQIMYEAESIK
jgi:hypothetical protein